MARPPKGKALTLRPIRLDDDVWAECQRLGKAHGTINEGISAAFAALQMQEAQGRVTAITEDSWKAHNVAVSTNVELKPSIDLLVSAPDYKPFRSTLNKERPFKGPILRPKDRK